jgi:hypothetical protein
VGALTSRNPMGLHGLEQGYLYFYFTLLYPVTGDIQLRPSPPDWEYDVRLMTLICKKKILLLNRNK